MRISNKLKTSGDGHKHPSVSLLLVIYMPGSSITKNKTGFHLKAPPVSSFAFFSPEKEV